MPEPLLKVSDLTVTFPNADGGVRAVRGVDYTVDEGEFLGIVGESGSGKSVSSLAVMGLLPSSAQITGDITFRGESLLGMRDRELSRLRGRDMAMIFQDPLSALTPVYTVGQQIEEALTLHDKSLSARSAEKRAVELLKIVGIPAPERRVKAFPHEFSGGMRQRAMIAIAMANDPTLIIADEPTTALDVTIQAQILEVLQKAKEVTGAAVVLITHDLGVVAGNVDRVAVMYAGKLVEKGPVDQVFAAPRMPYTMGLLRSVPNMLTAGTERLVPLEGRPPNLAKLPAGCPFADRCPAAQDRCRTTEPELVAEFGDGREVACHRADEIAAGTLQPSDIFPRPAHEERELSQSESQAPVVRAQDLVRHFPLYKGSVFRRAVGTVKAVDGVDFEVRPGETLGLVGESGSGKSTTALEIMELTAPQRGSLEVTGKDVSSLSKADRLRMRQDVQIVFQDPMAAVDPRMPVGDIIAEPLTVHRVPRAERNRRVLEMLDLVGLAPEMTDRYPHEFSGGQRQRIGIARALITNPKVLVLDEPVSALDVSVQAGVINLLEDLRDQLGLSYLFVAHDLAIVREIADTIAVMYLGRIVEYGPVQEVFESPRHPYTRALMSAVPVPDPAIERERRRILLTGDMPSPTEDIPGCNFASRCPLFRMLDEDRQAQCLGTDPAQTAHGASRVACHHVEEIGRLDDADISALSPVPGD
ncbi:ABC transporter ATP-binding protein [Brachybacterium saurashtrense]|uniref:ABC transporter ATP-binding protein n=1 Tax=Brachybacterium saurashtrense TaxID=556288 RepID=A0A345YKH8_9MICO|nr:ABC transporter ATP-binding protein [Brachybacterium saurashtrense]AXK44430.1 ABC transporter ATP-binding protein [Brachybacterium saurashtrense]RRR23042.1 ABC transporter ATP-binding protein [Brachybacterium saurashtrense]